MEEVLDKIHKLSNEIMSKDMAYNLRKRYNPHHPQNQKDLEKRLFLAEQQKLFFEMKEIYLSNRNEIQEYIETLSDDLKRLYGGTIQALEKCITDDMEAEFLCD